jgi:YD repeat-containing protein
MRTSIVGLLVWAFLMSFAGARGHAQSDPCQHWATGVPGNPFPAGFGPWNCYLIEYVGYTCSVYTCPPSDPPPCKECSAGSPIDLITGNVFIEETDVKIPGLSGGLTLARTWNSKWPSGEAPYQVGMFGQNWTSTYEEHMFRQSIDYQTFYRYARADGTLWAFAGYPLYLVAPENVVATLGVDTNYTSWIVKFHNGEQRVFSFLSGSLTAIIDRNGNTTSLSYDAINRLVTVTDPAGRHLYFNYPNNSTYLVSSVTSDVGLTVSYTYDAQSRLTQVTENDGSFVTFTYDANSNIIAVKDSLGNLLESHTYDNEHRGLTSSRGSAGAEAVTVSYPNP